ncbi:hypothetical protein HVMH_0593 [Hydrogenovibrio marinus]|nr:hypothetical protein HVMH_0593 [Hydrogenovibrio marinus]
MMIAIEKIRMNPSLNAKGARNFTKIGKRNHEKTVVRSNIDNDKFSANLEEF